QPREVDAAHERAQPPRGVAHRPGHASRYRRSQRARCRSWAEDPEGAAAHRISLGPGGNGDEADDHRNREECRSAQTEAAPSEDASLRAHEIPPDLASALLDRGK